ncbi:MAG: T9SS type A sorting domain-containing protein, partial [Melioribacteraceae bacterium]|nr:T9SS type A sorting domain-containing protein [Melioribacteraceae bacterium]
FTNSYMKFFNSDSGIIASRNWIRKTFDGGENIELVKDNSVVVANTLCFVDMNVGYGFDEENRLMKTTNSGEDWIVVNELTSMQDEKLLFNKHILYQNYPNPFNPSTTIKYSIPNQSNVTLKVFDLLGSEVATLVNKEQSQGNYEVGFDGSELTSGIYFYRLQSGNFVETKKMILLK